MAATSDGPNPWGAAVPVHALGGVGSGPQANSAEVLTGAGGDNDVGHADVLRAMGTHSRAALPAPGLQVPVGQGTQPRVHGSSTRPAPHEQAIIRATMRIINEIEC